MDVNFVRDLNKSLNHLSSVEIKLMSMSKQDFTKINVGGTIFATKKSTLGTYHRIKKPNLLESLVTGITETHHDDNNAIFIDRNPRYFEYVLDYLRELDNFVLPDKESDLKSLLKDAEYYRLDELAELTTKKIMNVWFPESFMNYEQKKNLIELCKFPVSQKWNLIYKARRNGFEAADFHSRCDGFEGTLTIVKTSKGLVFGGYTEASWSHSDGFKEDKNAFVFSLVNMDGEPMRMMCEKKACAIFCHTDYGPTFGDGHDIFIENSANELGNSYANLGDSYKHPKYAYGSDEAKAFLGGSLDFKISDVEVYSKH